MSTKSKVGLFLCCLFGISSIVSLIQFLSSNLETLAQTTSQAYVNGRIIGGISIPIIMILIIYRIIIKNRNRSTL